MQRALFIIFALWGSVKLLDITYTRLIRERREERARPGARAAD